METGNSVTTQNKPWLFQPGQSGNPAGPKPGYRHFKTLFKEAIVKIADGEAESDDVIMVKQVVAKAKKGDLKAYEIVRDEVDGPMNKNETPSNNTTINVIQFTGDIVNGTIDPEDLS